MHLSIENVISWTVFLLISAAVVVIMDVEKTFRRYKAGKNRLREQREQILGRKSGRIEVMVGNERSLASLTGTSGIVYLVLMAASIVGGYILGQLIFTDSLVALCVAGACIVLPHTYLILKRNRDSRERAENLEAAMRVITHEYISTLDIEKAVENSVDIIDHDQPFREFLVDCKMVSTSMERNLRRLEAKESNMYFSRWIDQLILTLSDRQQIANLSPILEGMNDAKTAQRQNDTKVAAAWRDYFTLLIIILISPLLIRVIQYEWYSYLITTLIGKILIIAMLASLVWSTGRALKINKPITG